MLCYRVHTLLLLRCGLWGGRWRLDKAGDQAGIHTVHEKQSLEDGVGELRRLTEELGCASGIVGDEILHLGEDVEELWGGKRVEGFGNGVGAREVWRQLGACWERSEDGIDAGVLLLPLVG